MGMAANVSQAHSVHIDAMGSTGLMGQMRRFPISTHCQKKMLYNFLFNNQKYYSSLKSKGYEFINCEYEPCVLVRDCYWQLVKRKPEQQRLNCGKGFHCLPNQQSSDGQFMGRRISCSPTMFTTWLLSSVCLMIQEGCRSSSYYTHVPSRKKTVGGKDQRVLAEQAPFQEFSESTTHDIHFISCATPLAREAGK